MASHALLSRLGAVLLLTTLALVAWQLRRGAGLPFEDWALDSDRATTSGEVVALTPQAARGRADVLRVTFRYRHDGVDYEQACHVPAGAPMTGLQHTVEFLTRAPEVSRLRGALRAMPPTVSWNVVVTVAGVGTLLALLGLRIKVAQRQRQGPAHEPAHGRG